MKIWALADLHLPFGAPNKEMGVFGLPWKNYTKRIEGNWRKRVGKEDLVLIAGDISWAMKFEDAMKDLEWINALPGKKVILKGNHDYWWPSNKKLREGLPPSIQFIHNTAVTIEDITIGGARLWDTPEFHFNEYIVFQKSKYIKANPFSREQSEHIFERDLKHLRKSLSQMDPNASYRIAMTHYPPIGADLKDSQASKILEEFGVHICIFGHLHNVEKKHPMFGKKNQILYLFTAADYLGFDPLMVKG